MKFEKLLIYPEILEADYRILLLKNIVTIKTKTMAINNLFDANFYRAANSDLRNFSDSQALSHFQTYGLNEGRAFSPFANLNFYRSSNSDLANFNNSQLFEHLQNYGIGEGRRFSPEVDLNFYRAANSDLARLNFNNEQLFEHLRSYGLSEGRQFSQFFNLNYYKSYNADLVAAKLDNSQLLVHFELYGLSEGRTFSFAFDVNSYKSYNADLVAAKLSNSQLLEHFQTYGLNEGRQSSPSFSASYYRANNGDLANFSNYQAYNHFVLYGHSEGRLAAPPSSSIPSEIGSSLSKFMDVGSLRGNSFTEFSGTTSNSDFYRFTLGSSLNIALTLSTETAQTGLKGQISLVQDRNGNNTIDSGEELNLQLVNLLPTEESSPQISSNLGAGTYYVHVFPADSSSTEYSLRLRATN